MVLEGTARSTTPKVLLVVFLELVLVLAIKLGQGIRVMACSRTPSIPVQKPGLLVVGRAFVRRNGLESG
ncbi:hypothetical protein PG990_014183 [Apiospora arundinis]